MLAQPLRAVGVGSLERERVRIDEAELLGERKQQVEWVVRLEGAVLRRLELRLQP